MATREEIAAQIAAIDRTLNAGVESVTHGETSTRWNIAELRRRKAELQNALAVIDGAPARVRQIRTYTVKGY